MAYTQEYREKINAATHLACGEYCNSLEDAIKIVKDYAKRTSYHSRTGEWHCYTEKQVSPCGKKIRSIDHLANAKTGEKEKRIGEWEKCVQTF